LIEGNSKKSENDWSGRNSQNKTVVFPKGNSELKKGEYVEVRITSVTGATLLGEVTMQQNLN
jgi:tRNA-2-methylthio-N6-dimethylallyladenosine synthase